MISIEPPNYEIEMKGFKEKEILFFQSIAYNEHLAIKIPVDKTTAFGYSPGVIGKKGGINYLQFTRLSGENLKLQLPWGLELLKYNVYEENNELKLKIKDEAFLTQNPEVAKYFRSKRTPTATFTKPKF